MLRIKKPITIMFSILICLSLFGCNQKEVEQTTIKETQEETKEPLIQEIKEEIKIEETKKEEIVEEKPEVVSEEVTIISNSKEDVITAKSYVLHVGIAENIELTVKRLYSKVGASLCRINPETTKIYEGDRLSISVSTKSNMEPVFNVANVIQNKDLTYTVSTSDVIVTTGYNYVGSIPSNKVSSDQHLVYFYSSSGGSDVTLYINGINAHDDTDSKNFEISTGDTFYINISGTIGLQVYKYSKTYGTTLPASPNYTVLIDNDYMLPGMGNTSGTTSTFTVEDGYNYYIGIYPQNT